MQNTIQTYLNNLLTIYPTYSLTSEDKKRIETEGIAVYLLAKILSNKYRKTSIDETTRQTIFTNIQTCIDENKPLRFTIPIGGYKKWQLPTAPEVDWSEFFHLRYMCEYFAPLLAVYKPGVILDYFSNAWLIKYISYYPQSDLDAYTASFRKLIDVLKPSFPSNLQLRYFVTSEQKPESVLIDRILKNKPQVEVEWEKLSKDEQQERLAYSDRNIRWDILEKNGELSQEERNRIIKEGKIIHDALLKGGWNSDLFYLRNDHAIPLIHRKSHSEFLHLATCAGSFVQFWVGIGLLEVKDDILYRRILSMNQHKEVKEKLQSAQVDLLPLHNFKNIDYFSSNLLS